jgi:hypothetical protein
MWFRVVLGSDRLACPAQAWRVPAPVDNAAYTAYAVDA